MKYEMTVSNDIKELQQIHTFLEEVAAKWDITQELLFQLNLVVEETVSNIILYGYDEPKGKEIIHIEITKEGHLIKIVITDNGKAFNPLSIPPPDDLDKDAQDRHIGGLGVYFIRKLMDEVAYRREQDRNILILSKNISN